MDLYREKSRQAPRFLVRKKGQSLKFAPYLIEIKGNKKIFHFRALLNIHRARFSTELLTETTQIWGIGVPRVHVFHESWELLFFLVCNPPFALCSPSPAQPRPHPSIRASNPAISALISVLRHGYSLCFPERWTDGFTGSGMRFQAEML
jgi:hypothetical protein